MPHETQVKSEVLPPNIRRSCVLPSHCFWAAGTADTWAPGTMAASTAVRIATAIRLTTAHSPLSGCTSIAYERETHHRAFDTSGGAVLRAGRGGVASWLSGIVSVGLSFRSCGR